jgi:hypothetical protein
MVNAAISTIRKRASAPASGGPGTAGAAPGHGGRRRILVTAGQEGRPDLADTLEIDQPAALECVAAGEPVAVLSET